MEFIGIVLIIFVLFAINVLPWLLALLSSKVSGEQKLIWFLMSFFLSWLGFFVYYVLVVRNLGPKKVMRDYAGRTIR